MSSPQIPTLPEAMENTLTLPVNESNGTTSCLRIVVLDPLALSRQDVHHWQPILDWLGQESATVRAQCDPTNPMHIHIATLGNGLCITHRLNVLRNL